MAHFAQLNEQNIVTQVIVVANQELFLDGIENEEKGIAFCQSLLGGVWKQTSYNGNMRKNYAGIGFTFDESRNAFIPPQPYSNWTLVEETCRWASPVAYPTDGKLYNWNESTLTWIEAVTS